ncbi:chemotaxis protein CheW [Rhodobacter sp. Har01]|uniref:chemotaxis protein CheW n=1 Tax=Rhodobacter sp. Har01 TaxID=2883999 RepID=UPI001D082700|nr:chemotaxis protein CheW [Rhodobacter sp. Har01]MCB6179266.1 chemotaxis protein CheW [Rhodobacter sp. Har01]
MAKAKARPGPDHDLDTPETAAAATATATDMHQFVTFFLGEECFAFPMETVLEIIRVPAMVRVPLTPDGFEGLSNLRGAILPVMDLRRAIGLPARSPDDASRTVVVDCGRPVGLIVDRVSRVVSFAADRIAPQETGSALGRSGSESVLSGVIKDSDGVGLIQILDARSAIALASLAARGKAGRAEARAREETASAAAASATVQLVNLLIENQEYAFDLAEVDEIVRPPEAIFQLPQVASHVLGIIDLRNRLLPIVSLRRMFGLADLAMAETNRILVVRVPGRDGTGEGAQARVGIVVDQVREVMNVQACDLVPVSGLINRDGRHRIGQMCRLDDGRRLLGVLSCATLFDDAEIVGAITKAAGSARTEEDAVVETVTETLTEETQLVVYQLAGQDYGIEIAAVREIIRVPADLKRVPQSPDHVAGVINVRGAILPVVSMRARFGIAQEATTDRQRIVVLSRDGVQTGYIVDSVTEVLRISRASLEPAPQLSAEQSRLIGTVANLNDGARIIQIVDALALFGDQGPGGAGDPPPPVAAIEAEALAEA